MKKVTTLIACNMESQRVNIYFHRDTFMKGRGHEGGREHFYRIKQMEKCHDFATSKININTFYKFHQQMPEPALKQNDSFIFADFHFLALLIDRTCRKEKF